MIDLRSDTLTKPTDVMRLAMARANVGDDVFNEDPTIHTLEDRIAALFGKEAALFFPSGTMSNLAAMLTWCPYRGTEVIMGDQSHTFLFEQAGLSQFGGLTPRTVANLADGTMDLQTIRDSIRDDDIHEPRTGLICIENTHNVCGGKVLPIEFMKELRDLTPVPIHLDGARIWNALQEYNHLKNDNDNDKDTDKDKDKDKDFIILSRQIGSFVDSLSVCLSKGLGAPVGSVLVGPQEFITKARRCRKALGGGMRQVGILGAAGLVALQEFINDGNNNMIGQDHDRTKQIADFLLSNPNPIFKVREPVETNIIFIEINEEFDSAIIAKQLSDQGVLVSAWSKRLIRLVLHRDITDVDVTKVCQAFSAFLL